MRIKRSFLLAVLAGIVLASILIGPAVYAKGLPVTWKTVKMAGLDLSPGEAIKSIQFLDQKVGYFAGGDGVMFKTTDGGTTWTQLPTKTKASIKSVSFIDANTGWVAFGPTRVSLAPNLPPFLSKTLDGGKTFSEVSPGIGISKIKMLDGNNGYCFTEGSKGNIFSVTSDGGVTWRNIKEAESSDVALNDFAVIDANTCVIVTQGGEVFKTTDGGGTWTTTKLVISNPTGDLPTKLNAVKFLNANVGWVAGDDYFVAKTEDGGTTWTNANPKEKFGNQQLFAIDVKSPREVLVTGNTEGVISRTINGGISWIAEKAENDYGSFFGIAFLGQGKAFAIGNGGNGYFAKLAKKPDKKK